jgi:hypothetical protein
VFAGLNGWNGSPAAGQGLEKTSIQRPNLLDSESAGERSLAPDGD